MNRNSHVADKSTAGQIMTFVRIASGWDSYSFVYTAIPTSTQFFPYMKFVEEQARQ